MSLRILKYPIPANSFFELELPKPARILSIQEQKGELMLWAAGQEGGRTEKRRFTILCTGERFEDPVNQLVYLTTVQHGILVLHIFEVRQ